MMVGRDIDLSVDKAPAKTGATVLELDALTVTDDYGRRLLDEVSLTVASGEIVGIAGIQGNGQTELVQAITGLLPIEGGQVLFEGHDITQLSPRKHHEAGIAHVRWIAARLQVGEAEALLAAADGRVILQASEQARAATAAAVSAHALPGLRDAEARATDAEAHT